MAESEVVEDGRIRQLDERTIGFIAAGEVVERPAQVVKELLENSIDAGAEWITVEIQRGGFDLIKVSDDGGGIHRGDLPLSLDRHATSKLRDEHDLSSINTLGFRGEALASIGMVSNLKVSSRATADDSDSGWCIEMNDGHKGEVEPCGMPLGTVIEVADLFASQPARLAFQRRPSTETARIVDVVVQQAMAEPKVRIGLVSDEKVLLEAPAAEEPLDRLYDLLGAQASRLLPLKQPPGDEDAPGAERWTGWISPPDISRSRGDEVNILINGRPVAAQSFQASIRRGYHTRLMVGRHPVCVLQLEIPSEEVDVNVHPTKREVRLKNSWRVLERLERAIKHTLSTTPTDTSIDDESPLSGLPRISKSEPVAIDVEPEVAPSWVQTANSVDTVQVDLVGEPTDEKPTWRAKPRPVSSSPQIQQTLPGMDVRPVAPALSSDERDLHRHAGGDVASSPLDEPESENSGQELIPEMEPLAQFADSYILAQGGEGLYIIDQHALHERIRYERIRNSPDSWSPQPLITPLPIEMSVLQTAAADGNRELLERLGIELQQQDGEWNLLSIPVLLAGDNRLHGFLQDLLTELSEEGSEGHIDAIDHLQDQIAFMRSCRGAVKANQSLNIAEMRRLLADMRSIDNPWACVHGRPTVLKIEAEGLDHHFGRHG